MVFQIAGKLPEEAPSKDTETLDSKIEVLVARENPKGGF